MYYCRRLFFFGCKGTYFPEKRIKGEAKNACFFVVTKKMSTFAAQSAKNKQIK